MGRYRRKPGNGNLDHFYAVEALATRLHPVLADWLRYQAFNGNALEVLRDALLVTLGPKTFHQVTNLQMPNHPTSRTSAATTTNAGDASKDNISNRK